MEEIKKKPFFFSYDGRNNSELSKLETRDCGLPYKQRFNIWNSGMIYAWVSSNLDIRLSHNDPTDSSDVIKHVESDLLGEHPLSWKNNLKYRFNKGISPSIRNKTEKIRQKILTDDILMNRFLQWKYFYEYNNSKNTIENFKNIVTDGKDYFFNNDRMTSRTNRGIKKSQTVSIINIICN